MPGILGTSLICGAALGAIYLLSEPEGNAVFSSKDPMDLRTAILTIFYNDESIYGLSRSELYSKLWKLKINPSSVSVDTVLNSLKEEGYIEPTLHGACIHITKKGKLEYWRISLFNKFN